MQELHAYNKMAQLGLAPEFACPVDDLHGEIVPWLDDEDNIYLWCIYCNAKVFLGSEKEEHIKRFIY